MNARFDYIIVGAGSSGCVLANRLSADPDINVCLLEAGSHDRSVRIQVPAGTITLYKSRKYSWNYFSTPQKGLNNRRLHTPRGRALGGSSSMNSMIYIRGAPADYDQWQAAGCPGWSWQDVLPWFKKSEHNRLGQDPALHGRDGELWVDRPRDPNPLSAMFVTAADRAGVKQNADFNGMRFGGSGIYAVTQKDAKRLSSYRAFVAPVRHRPNLTILRDTSVKSLLLEGHAVKGVKLANGKNLLAAREVIVCAGALGTPQLLLASGIGPAKELETIGITAVTDLPGVGKNLQDHLDGLVTVRSGSAKTLGFSVKALPRILAAPFRYILRQKGDLTTNYVEAGGFAKTPLAGELPDIQFHFVPGYRSHRGRLFEWGHGYAVHTCVLHPKSIGEVRLDKHGELLVDFNFLADMEDARVLIEGIKIARKILADPVFAPYRGKEMLPGEKVQTDAELLEYVREYAATVFHPVGTCKMGQDAMSVTDPSSLKVYGVDCLRVADASVMPVLVSGNTNAPCIMIGERAADMIVNGI